MNRVITLLGLLLAFLAIVFSLANIGDLTLGFLLLGFAILAVAVGQLTGM